MTKSAKKKATEKVTGIASCIVCLFVIMLVSSISVFVWGSEYWYVGVILLVLGICCICFQGIYLLYAIKALKEVKKRSTAATYYRYSGRNAVSTTSVARNSSPTQLHVACAAMAVFVQSFHKDGVDSCCLAKFGSSYTRITNLQGKENDILSAIGGIARAGTSGCTRLFDSIVDFAQYLCGHGQGRPVILIVVTDGDDTDSTRSPETTNQALRGYFGPSSPNFLFILGVGDDINFTKLNGVTKNKCGEVIEVREFGKLMLVFTVLAARVQELVKVSALRIRGEGGEVGLVGVQRQQVLERVGVTYGILIDISGSMDAAVKGLEL